MLALIGQGGPTADPQPKNQVLSSGSAAVTEPRTTTIQDCGTKNQDDLRSGNQEPRRPGVIEPRDQNHKFGVIFVEVGRILAFQRQQVLVLLEPRQ